MKSCPFCNGKRTSEYCIKDEWAYYLCRRCNCLFLRNNLNKTNLDRYYKENFQYDFDDLTKRRVEKIAKNVVLKLTRLNPRGKTLLDIGSGHGYILEEAKEKGIQALGIEPSLVLYRETLKRFHVKNINLNEFSKINKLKFDFITLSHIIEHLPSLKKLPQILDNLLNKNGIIFIETPNYDSWLRVSEKCEYTFLTPPDHIYILSINSIKNIFKSRPWKLILKSTYSYPEHLVGILRRLKRNFLNKRNGIHHKNVNSDNQFIPIRKKKFIVELLAYILSNFLNYGNKGSILQIYIKKI